MPCQELTDCDRACQLACDLAMDGEPLGGQKSGRGFCPRLRTRWIVRRDTPRSPAILVRLSPASRRASTRFRWKTLGGRPRGFPWFGARRRPAWMRPLGQPRPSCPRLAHGGRDSLRELVDNGIDPSKEKAPGLLRGLDLCVGATTTHGRLSSITSGRRPGVWLDGSLRSFRSQVLGLSAESHGAWLTEGAQKLHEHHLRA